MAFLAVTLAFLLMNGCGTPDNGEPENGSRNEEEENMAIDIQALDSGDFKDGQYLKVDWWALIEGEERTGWFEIEVFVIEDFYFDFEYAGAWGEQDYAGSTIIERPHTSIKHAFSNYLLAGYPELESIWEETAWNWLQEHFSGLEKVGDRLTLAGREVAAPGHDTYAGQEGLTFTLKAGGAVEYELCVSPELPLNLYSYRINDEGEYYKAELVEFRQRELPD